mmetsp:Transcript_18950/g.60873  ORF Transcript_18950/g.60873 Transcript_18950/m.60873 type:complete len:202 (+) Transcript_18950:1227-1832(+)
MEKAPCLALCDIPRPKRPPPPAPPSAAPMRSARPAASWYWRWKLAEMVAMWLASTLPRTSTYLLRTSPMTSFPCWRRNTMRYFMPSSGCCRNWMFVLGFFIATNFVIRYMRTLLTAMMRSLSSSCSTSRTAMAPRAEGSVLRKSSFAWRPLRCWRKDSFTSPSMMASINWGETATSPMKVASCASACCRFLSFTLMAWDCS